MAHEVTLIPGDGTGPELVEATRRVLEATGVEFEWDEHPAGEDVYEEEGTPFPDGGAGFRSVKVLLRKELEAAIASVIKKGERVTYDLEPTRDDPSAVGTSQFAGAVIEEMN